VPPLLALVSQSLWPNLHATSAMVLFSIALLARADIQQGPGH
jgi:hypothetical protein